MNQSSFLKDYYDVYFGNIQPDWLFDQLEICKESILKTNRKGGRLIFAGNGASAAIASHVALDFTKQGKITSTTFHDPALMTAFANDFGYDKGLAKMLECYMQPNDMAVFISVSGESPNIVEAAKYVKAQDRKLVTFTGKSPENSLKQLGDINFWVDSHAYNIVECIHMMWITTIIDMIIGKSVYSVS